MDPHAHTRPFDRRHFLRILAAGAAGSALCRRPGPLEAAIRPPSGERPHLAGARAAHRWIRAHRVETRHGVTWPVAPSRSGDASTDLYHGSPGVVLFLAELAAAVDDDVDVRAEMVAGADHLLGAVEAGEVRGHGLYTGLAGVAYALERAHHVSGESRFREGAVACIDAIVAAAAAHAGGVVWDAADPAAASSDIVSGAAGIGLALLWAAEVLDHPAALTTAHAAGTRLVAVSEAAPGGLLWLPSPASSRNYPNFSHGTAGVATFLARLGRATDDGPLLQAAVRGAGYLRTIERCDAGCAVYHHTPGGEDLYYLSWCHGPPGTARLFGQLAAATGDPAWMAWVARGARAVRDFGVPERRSPGYWNNVSQCCGDAGVGEFFLALHLLDGDDGHLDFARRIGDWILGRATSDQSGRAWVQAENRVSPDDVVAQTGWMQGAAGVGAFLLHLDGRIGGRAPVVRLPDDLWGR